MPEQGSSIPPDHSTAEAPPATGDGYAPAREATPTLEDGRTADAGPADTRGEENAFVARAPSSADEAPEREEAPRKPPLFFDPLAPYKGAFRRFFTVYRHVLGLLAGGMVAYVRALPPGERSGFTHMWARMTAFFVGPFVSREMRRLSFAKQLRRRLEILGPTFIKLGQIMAIREDLLPREITRELENLLDKLPEVPFEQVQAIIERDLRRPLGELFEFVQRKPLGSASIAQAHLAVTKDGQKAVVKVIKPGIREVITSDLKLLEAVGYLLQWALPRYQPKQIIEEFAAYTSKEVDYTFEADNAEIFSSNFADAPGIVFPTIYRDLSSDDVLTMEFIEGVRPGAPESLALSEMERARVVDLGAEAIIRMLYQDGFFHADLHAGNLKIIPAKKPGDSIRIGFIDLGMVGRFGSKVKRRLLYYFHALVRGDVENATRYLLEMARIGPGGDPQGFRRAVTDLARRFRMQGGRGDLSIAQLILESLSLGGKYRVFFPVEMTLMVKALVTFEGVGRTLEPGLDVAEISRVHVQEIFRDRFDPRALSRELVSNAPEVIDLIVQAPQLLATGVRFFEEQIDTHTPRPNPLAGLRSGILAGACIVAGALAAVQGGPWFLWLPLFTLGFWLAVLGGK